MVFINLAQIRYSFPVFDYLCTAHFYSLVNISSGNLTAFTYDISWLQVKNFCGTDDEEKHVKITATIETVSSVIVQDVTPSVALISFAGEGGPVNED